MSATDGSYIASEARSRYADGSNCAEAVMSALDGAPGLPEAPLSLGAGFTGGIGHSGCVCGALAGGVAVLGHYAASLRLEPVATRLLAEKLAAELHERFNAQFGASCCRVIKRGQTTGSDGWLAECAGLTEWTAAETLAIIAEHAGPAISSRWTPLDLMSVARRASLGVLAAGALAVGVGAVAPSASAESLVPAAGVALSIGAVAAEMGGAAARRAGRVLRVGGVAASAALVTVLAVAPQTSERLLAPLVVDSVAALVLRIVLALAALVAAGTAAFGLKRYR